MNSQEDAEATENWLQTRLKMAASISDSLRISASEDVIDVDGNTYKTVKIGEQTWTVENFRASRYNDGSPIIRGNCETSEDNPEVTFFESEIPGIIWMPDWEKCNLTKFPDGMPRHLGALYNQYAVRKNNFAPQGWHIPSAAEWESLIKHLGGNDIASTFLLPEFLDGNGLSRFDFIPTPRCFPSHEILPGSMFPMAKSNYGFLTFPEEEAFYWMMENGSHAYLSREFCFAGPFHGFNSTFGISVRLVKDA